MGAPNWLFLCLVVPSLLLCIAFARPLAPASQPAPYIGVSLLSGFQSKDPAKIRSILDQIPNFDFTSLKLNPVVGQVCSNTDYSNECIFSILHSLNTTEGTQIAPSDILRMEMQALYDQANATIEIAKRFKDDPNTSILAARILDTCVENYSTLLDDLLDASTAMEARDSGRLETVLSATITEISTCSDSFAEKPDLESPMQFVDDFLLKMCSNVLALSQTTQMG